jgi:hypothetical protein
MFEASGKGSSKEEATAMALEELKQRLWEECWKKEIELPGVVERVIEKDGLFEVFVKIK